uniref:Zinc finger protein Pegasus n=1 Tax=Eptatretus burgeri TaxID=7764 RepID=A0A8C4R866_EPTBU
MAEAMGVTVKMEEDRDLVDPSRDPADFVKDFQEYLTQQTNQVNLISGSVASEREPEALKGGEVDRGLVHSDIEVNLEDGGSLPLDGYERTADGKLKCKFCEYACKGTARLEEHMRTHTGEKPYRCHLCSFASAYERHLEAHMRSHTGEKPYKCDLCAFRCSDRSNLSHHRRRRHKAAGLPTLAGLSNLSPRGLLSSRRSMLCSMASLGRRPHLYHHGPPSLSGVSGYHQAHQQQHKEVQRFTGDAMMSGHGDDRGYKALSDGGSPGDTPLSQLSALAGHINSMVATQSCGGEQRGSGRLMSEGHDSGEGLECDSVSARPSDNDSVSSVPNGGLVVGSAVSLALGPCPVLPSPEPASRGQQTTQRGSCSPYRPAVESGPAVQATSPASSTGSQRSTPLPLAAATLHASPRDPLLCCPYCDIVFPDNVLYTIHMGCHGCENPFQCNLCGHRCRDRYDFSCHFARGQHKMAG